MADRITGMEALVRWEHPEEVHLMKTRGLIDERACLSVNVSTRHFEEPDFVDAIAGILERSGVDPRQVQVEITETAAGGDRDKVRGLKSLGVRVAIDDFGTGYSSLAYVKDLDVDVLKVDRVFVQSLGADPASIAIVRTILTLADMLDVEVIIEGVEDPAQLVQLQTLGGCYVQGFMFGRPVPAAGLPAAFARGPAKVPVETARVDGVGALLAEVNVA